MYLGPTGRTKHTEDVPQVHVEPASPAVAAVMEIKHLRTTLNLLKWVLISLFAGLSAWILVTSIIELAEAPERDSRIDACATAMASESARETPEVPIPQCESLSASERREAAYVYAQREGLL